MPATAAKPETKPQHTPGPWKVTPTKTGRYPERQIVDANGRYIAAVQIMAHNPACDDARLIAATPDLLAALKELADASRSYIGAMDDEDLVALERARAAITKSGA